MRIERVRNLFIILVLLSVAVVGVLFTIAFVDPVDEVMGFAVTALLCVLMMLGWFTYVTYNYNKSKTESTSSFNMLTNKALSFGGVGMITFSSNNNIVTAVSNYLEDRGFKELIGKSISELNKDLAKLSSVSKMVIQRDGRYYDIEVYYSLNTIIVKDYSAYHELYTSFNEQQSAIVLVRVGYYNTTSQNTKNDRQRINNVVANVMTAWSEENSAFLKLSSSDGESSTMFMNKRALELSISDKKNNLLLLLQTELNKEELKAVISIGAALGNANNYTMGNLAQEAIELSENRGGDQMVLKEYGEKTEFFTGKEQEVQPISKVPAKTFLDFISSEIKIADNVIISGHYNADLDAVAAMAAFDHVSESAGKDAYLLLDTIEPTAEKALLATLTKKQKERIIGPSKATRLLTPNTLLIVVDTSSLNQTPMKEVIKHNVKKKKVFIIDHHRASEDKIQTLNSDYEYIDVVASSTSEIASDILSFLTNSNKKKISSDLANLLLTGIYLDTKQLTRKTTSKTLNASGWLAEQGANPVVAHDYLKVDVEVAQRINEIEKTAENYKNKVIIAHTNETDKKNSNISTLISITAEKLSDIKDIKAAFVIAEISENTFRVSARSIDEFNVQTIAEAMGGGGHYNAAAFVKENTTLDNVIKELKYNIDLNLDN